MPLINENVGQGLPRNSKFQVGVTDVDSGLIIEQGIRLPQSNGERATYLYFECSIGTMLDSGIVVHNTLPQVDNTPDTLASDGYGTPDFSLLTNGVNLQCKDQYRDIVQRMGHARYWFRIWGKAMRLGIQIPIPGIKFIGGVPAIPYDKNPQWAYNSPVSGGSYSGVPLWRAEWSLWYTTAVPPVNSVFPVSDPTTRISLDDDADQSIQVPYSRADDNAVPVNTQLGALARAINNGILGNG